MPRKVDRMPVPRDKRPTYESISGSDDDFNRLWESTEAAPEMAPLPSGSYRCLVSDGRLAQAATGTRSYKVAFAIIDGKYTNRKVWMDLWLTDRALAMTKRDLAKLQITRPEQLNKPPRPGIIAEVRVALRTEDDGRQYNKVNGFTIVEKAPAPSVLGADADEEADTPEGNDPVTDGDDSEVPF
jgi:hypothetical protein